MFYFRDVPDQVFCAQSDSSYWVSVLIQYFHIPSNCSKYIKHCGLKASDFNLLKVGIIWLFYHPLGKYLMYDGFNKP